jgi:hypothetical protein
MLGLRWVDWLGWLAWRRGRILMLGANGSSWRLGAHRRSWGLGVCWGLAGAVVLDSELGGVLESTVGIYNELDTIAGGISLERGRWSPGVSSGVG